MKRRSDCDWALDFWKIEGLGKEKAGGGTSGRLERDRLSFWNSLKDLLIFHEKNLL